MVVKLGRTQETNASTSKAQGSLMVAVQMMCRALWGDANESQLTQPHLNLVSTTCPHCDCTTRLPLAEPRYSWMLLMLIRFLLSGVYISSCICTYRIATNRNNGIHGVVWKVDTSWLCQEHVGHRVLQGAPPRGRQLYFAFPSAPDPLFKAAKAPFLTLRVATPLRASSTAWVGPNRHL